MSEFYLSTSGWSSIHIASSLNNPQVENHVMRGFEIANNTEPNPYTSDDDRSSEEDKYST